MTSVASRLNGSSLDDVLLSIVRGAPHPIVLVSADDHVRSANQSAADLFDRPVSEIERAHINSLLSNNSLTLSQSLTTAGAASSIAREDGTQVPVTVYQTILASSPSGTVRFYHITPRRRKADKSHGLPPHDAKLVDTVQGLLNRQQVYNDAFAAFSLERVATGILDRLRAFITCSKASVQLIANERRVLLAGYGFNPRTASPLLLGRVDHDPLIREIAESRLPLIIPDTRSSPRWLPQPETQDVSSWVGVPILFRDRFVGLITIDHDTPGFYEFLLDGSHPARQSLDALAAAVSVDIHEATLFDAAQRHFQAFSLVNRIAELLSASLDPKTLLNLLAQAIVEGLPCSHCGILLLTTRDGISALETTASAPQDSAADSHVVHLESSFPMPRSVVLDAYLYRQSVIVHDFDDPDEASRYDRTSELGAHVQSALATPIYLSDQPIGVIVVTTQEVNRFTDTDGVLLDTIARHTSAALERARGLELLRQVGRDILRASDVDTLLQGIVTGALQLTHTDSGVIYLFSDDGRRITDRFHPPGFEHPTPRLKKADGITRTVIDSRAIVEIPDTSVDKRVNPALTDLFKSIYATPLTLDGRVVGVLYLNGRRSRALTQTERSLLVTLADQAAIVIQRTRLDSQIRDSEAMYRSLVDHIPQSVFRKDVHLNFTFANEAYCRGLGRSLTDVLGRRARDFYPPDVADGFEHDDRQVMHSRRSLEKEELHDTGGQVNPIRVRLVKTPVLDGDGAVIGVQGIFWDITQEKALQERYRLLVEQSPDSIVLHKHGTITLANPAAVRLFGVDSEQDLRGQSILDFVHDADRPLASRRLDLLSRGQAVDQGLHMRIVRGSHREVVHVAVHARTLAFDSEIQVVFHDLTPVNRLLREMHHRVNKALNVVSGFVRDREKAAPSVEEARTFQDIHARIEAMARLQRILQAGGSRQSVGCRTYLGEVIAAVRECYPSDVDIELAVPEAPIEFDEQTALACGLIVTELVSNSLLHAFADIKPGTIVVNISIDGNSCTLQVADDGRGLGPNTSKSRGLDLVDELVKHALEGTITMEHDPGNGVHTTVEFPLRPVIG